MHSGRFRCYNHSTTLCLSFSTHNSHFQSFFLIRMVGHLLFVSVFTGVIDFMSTLTLRNAAKTFGNHTFDFWEQSILSTFGSLSHSSCLLQAIYGILEHSSKSYQFSRSTHAKHHDTLRCDDLSHETPTVNDHLQRHRLLRCQDGMHERARSRHRFRLYEIPHAHSQKWLSGR